MTTPVVDPLPAVHAAVRKALADDTDLMALVSGVFDQTPETIPYPYITLGEAIGTPDNAHDRTGQETVVTLHVWTQHRGHTPGLEIAARMRAVLDHRPLAVIGHDHIATRFEFQQTLTDPEPPGDIRHVVARYRIVTEHPPA
ncbi:DUF3168 domain-containing protein [Streptomyces sp. C10-9-1]|uniref:DUF3168 domain-containing protein n=1 Tax=Streptomyces sp. C10-9-1 TaxID=1859285 RepID=UPI003F49CE20